MQATQAINLNHGQDTLFERTGHTREPDPTHNELKHTISRDTHGTVQ